MDNEGTGVYFTDDNIIARALDAELTNNKLNFKKRSPSDRLCTNSSPKFFFFIK